MTTKWDELKQLAMAMPDLDWDSEFEDHEQTGFCTVYVKSFEIDGEEHEGGDFVRRCTAGQAEFVSNAKNAVLKLTSEIEQLTQRMNLQHETNRTLHSQLEGAQRECERAVRSMESSVIRSTYNNAYYAPRELGSDAEQIRAGVLAVLAMAKEGAQ